jgi:hypothetical protein
MVRKSGDLSTILYEIHKFASKTGIPISVCPILLHLWLDTNQENCSPICGQMKVDFGGTINEPKIFVFLKLIDKFTPIFQIDIDGKIFCVSKTEEYMHKKCDI